MVVYLLNNNLTQQISRSIYFLIISTLTKLNLKQKKSKADQSQLKLNHNHSYGQLQPAKCFLNINIKLIMEIHSSTKTALLWIFGVLVVLETTGLILSLFASNESSTSSSVLNLIFNAIMLTAIVKQWRLFLKICRIVLIVIIVLCVVALVLLIIAIPNVDKSTSDDPEQERNLLIANLVFLVIETLAYSLLAWLFGRYVSEMEGTK